MSPKIAKTLQESHSVSMPEPHWGQGSVYSSRTQEFKNRRGVTKMWKEEERGRKKRGKKEGESGRVGKKTRKEKDNGEREEKGDKCLSL